MRIIIGDVTLDLTDDQVDDLRTQLRVVPAGKTETSIDVKEKARVLGVDAATVYRHARDLGGVKVGNVWRFPPGIVPMGPTKAAEAGPKARRRKARSKPKAKPRSLTIRGRLPDGDV